MSSERWEELDRIFTEAKDLSVDRRVRFVAEACGTDEALRAEALGLLAAADASGDFLTRPALDRLAQTWSSEGCRLRPDDRIGPYRILRLLGSGGAGEVWRARDERLSRDVAIKILLPHLSSDSARVRLFAGEARAASALNHANVLTVHDVGEHEGLPYLVSECLEGQSLRQRLGTGPLPVAQAVAVVLAVARGLLAAHAHGIVHCDIKPENTFLRSDGGVKILDFGLATLQQSLEGPPPGAGHSMSGLLVAGTAGYMAPEQLRGEHVDARADLFALGVMLYEILTGEHPFRRGSTFETLHAVLTAKPTAINAEVPPELAGIVMRLLEKAPAARYASALELIVAVEQFVVTEPATVAGLAPRIASTPAGEALAVAEAVARRRWWTWAAAAAMGLAVIGVAAWHSERPLSTVWHGPTRLNVEIPPSVRLSTRTDTEALIALSPDGRRLVYQDAKGLFLRSLDSLQARLIPGTEHGSHPFFSPDGRWIGFAAGGRLQRVSVAGGAPRSITEAPQARGASWGEDGTIVYAPTPRSGLWRVPVEGGTPTKVTGPNADEDNHRWPQILPDGRTVLFTVQLPSGRGDESRIDVISLETGRQKTIVRGGTYGRYLPTGHIVFASRGAIFAAPFDLDALALSGPPVSALEDVRMGYDSTGVAQLDFASTGTAVYVAPHARLRRSRLWWVDRRGLTTPVPGPHPGIRSSLALSPKGSRLIAEVTDGSGVNLWLHDLRRQTWMPLTSDKDCFSPVWSPGGDRFAFTSNREGPLNLFWMPTEGGTAQRLTRNADWQHPTDWSGDGQVVFFHEQGPDSQWDIWEVPIGGQPRPLLRTRSSEGASSLSKDGRWLAYASDESGRQEVYVRRYRGADQKWLLSTEGGSHPRWSRDGRSLFYEAEPNTIMVVPIGNGPQFAPGSPTVAFKRDRAFAWDVAADGRVMIAEGAEAEPERLQIVVIPDWFDELKEKLRRR